MKGDKGICMFFSNNNLVQKTKFDTKENCQERIDTLISIGAYDFSTKPYKCKECKDWHMGNEKQRKDFSK